MNSELCRCINTFCEIKTDYNVYIVTHLLKSRMCCVEKKSAKKKNKNK